MRRRRADAIRKAAELTVQLRGHVRRSWIELEMQADAQRGGFAARAAACSAADRCTIRLVLVRIPSRCASTIPRLTPWLKPKSSAVTMSSLTRGSFGEGRSERPEPGFEIHQLADAPLGAVVQQRHGRPDDAMGVARTLRRVKQEVQRPLIG